MSMKLSYIKNNEKTSCCSGNHQNKIILFPKNIPPWAHLLNVFVAVLQVIVMGISIITFIFFARPWYGYNWWNFMDYAIRADRRLHFDLTFEVLHNLFFAGLVLFLGMNIFRLTYTIRHKLDWNTYLVWLYIHASLLILAFLASLSTHSISP